MKTTRRRELLSVVHPLLAMTLVWLAAVAVQATTTGNVTWSGGAGPGNPYWNVDANWAGNNAPAEPTPGTITLGTNGTGKLDQNRTIGKLIPATGSYNSGALHTLDLNGYTLTVEGDAGVNQCCVGYLLTLTNGTLRIGSDTKAGSILFAEGHAYHQLLLSRGMKLQTDTNTMITGILRGNTSLGEVDLRGVEVVGGILKAKQIYFYEQATGNGCYIGIKMDTNTIISAIQVQANLQFIGGAYFGDPATRKMLTNMNLSVGVSANQRGSMYIGGVGRTTTLNATGGGSLTAYLTTLRIPNSDSASSAGIVDIANMTSCLIDTTELLVGTDRAGPGGADVQNGTLRLPPGTTMTVGTAVIGGVTKGVAFVELTNSTVTVTNSITLNATAWITNHLGDTPNGLDVNGTLTDAGGHIHVNFLATPTVGTNWAIRAKGNAAYYTLWGMVAKGTLMSSGTYTGKKVGVVYDSAADYTYYAMVDTNVALPPVSVPYAQRTYELAPAGTVLLSVNDINNGSLDPAGRPITLAMSTNGVAWDSNLTFSAAADYTVTLKVTAGSDSGTNNCTVHIIPRSLGTTADVTWLGAAPTALMDRREWCWSANWMGGVPPSNPTPGTVNLLYFGMNVIGKLDQNRTIGRLYVSPDGNPGPAHILDLNGYTLTVAGDVGMYQCCRGYTLTLTNGTLRIGSDTKAGSILGADRYREHRLSFAKGAKLQTATNTVIQYCSSINAASSQIDLCGTEVVGGSLNAQEISLWGASVVGAPIKMDTNTIIGAIQVVSTLYLANGSYIGDPSTLKLPTNVNLTVGVSANRRGAMYIGGGDRTTKLLATAGGSCIAYLTTLRIPNSDSAGSAGEVDLSLMTNCLIDTTELLVGPDRAAPVAGDVQNGTLRLPPRTLMTVGTATIGGTASVGRAVFTLTNMFCSITNSFTLKKSGLVTIYVSTNSSGLCISNSLATAMDVATATNGAMQFRFLSAPVTPEPLYGLKWIGEHRTALKALLDAGTFAVSNAAPTKAVSVFRYKGDTYLGFQPPQGTVYVLH